MKWNAWGDPALASDLSDSIKGLLASVLGLDTDAPAELAAADVELTPSRLTAEDVAALGRLIGADHVSTADGDRLYRAGGKSTPDLLRRKRSHQEAPDGVVAPGTDEEVLALLQWCADAGVAVVPFGGGTSVVGGLDPEDGGLRAVISLDLQRFDALIDLDTESGQARLGAGVTGPAAEEMLGAQGFSIGHFPQSFKFATIGGFAAARSSGQASAGYGRFDDMVTALTVVTPQGIARFGVAPKSAAGPDLRQLFVGSEGTLGIITDVTVRVHKVPETTLHEAWHFPDFATGAAALRAVAQRGVGPTVMRLSDEVETGINLANPSGIGDENVAPVPAGGVLAVTTYEGDEAAAQARKLLTADLFTALGGQSVGAGPAQAWEHGRFNAPYLRDSLLAVGAGCETLETVTTWSNLSALKTAVTEALTAALGESGSLALVMCHISHVYPTGASLYFTVIYKQIGEPVAQWQAAKAAANAAITSVGASITHHHAVGADHRPWLAAEIGDTGVAVLRAVKEALDPKGILNPGKLIP
jgi:alkyldihydroxyacetonephosphate synthase